MKTLSKLLVVFVVCVICSSVSQADSNSVPAARLQLYGTADATGDFKEYVVYSKLWSPPGGEAFYYTSGYSIAGRVFTMDCMRIDDKQAFGVTKIEEEAGGGGGGGVGKKKKIEASYDSEGRIAGVEQVNRDPCEPNDVMVFVYDAKKKKIEKIEVYQGQDKKKEIELSGYCDNCPRELMKRPEKVRYTDVTDGNDWIEVQTSYDTGGRMGSIICRRLEHDHIGQLIQGFDPEGRLIMMCDGKDDDCDGAIDTPVVSAMLRYDENGQIKEIYDAVSDSNILEWTRTVTSPTLMEEEIRKKCIFGNPNVDTFTYTVTDETGYNTYTGNSVVTVPDGGGSVEVRNWNWWGEATPPSVVSADANWATLNANLGDPNLSNRVIFPILRSDGKLAGTLDEKEFSICDYSSKGRQGGMVLASNGTMRRELHFYEMAGDGSILTMLTMDEYGNVIAGIGGGAEELARYNFFGGWTSRLPARAEEDSGGKHDAWAIDDNVPAKSTFFEAWPESWGIQPYIPIYSETGDGTLYVAGAATPGGAYVYYQYGEDGEIEAIVRMNSVDIVNCYGKLVGDLDNDCDVDILDFAELAQNWLNCSRESEASGIE